jgi:hypothetical protein
LVTSPPTTTEKLAALKPVLGKDGVHLTDQGQFNFFNTLAKAVLGLRNGMLGGPPKPAVAAALPFVTGKKFFWRGFTSDRGSSVRPVSRGARDAAPRLAACLAVGGAGAAAPPPTLESTTPPPGATDATVDVVRAFLSPVFF